jgi:hypothetical protein
VSAYLIEVDDTEYGVTSPTIVGPFPDYESAAKFADELAMGEKAQGGQGGYSAVHVITDETCDLTPEGYRERYAPEDDS